MAIGINTSLSMLNASIGTNDSQKVLADAIKKLASGKKASSAGYAPAGALVNEKLKPELFAADRTASVDETAANVARVADGAAAKVGDLLKEARNILVAAQKGEGGVKEASAGNKRLNEIVDTINNLAATTSYGKKQVFDGAQSVAATNAKTGQAVEVAVPKLSAADLGKGATYANGQGGAEAPVATYGNLEDIRGALTTGSSDKVAQALGVVEKASGEVSAFRSDLDKVTDQLSTNGKTNSFAELQEKNAAANETETVRELSKVTMENIRSQVKMALMAQGKDNSQNLFQLLL